MKRLIAIVFIAATGCHRDWQADAMSDAETLVREQVKDPSLQFSGLQFTGDNRSGQTCGHFITHPPGGGEISTRFIVFIDGGGGQNPFIDSPSAPYPVNKDDFALNWRTQCLDLGYKAA